MKYDEETGIYLFDEKKQKFDPSFAEKLAELYSPAYAADFGCSLGEYVRFLREKGWRISGFEGSPVEKVTSGIWTLDLSQKQHTLPTFDLVLCLEVGEHVPPKREGNFLWNLVRASSRKLILSWATPGQGGIGHVNCKGQEEVVRIFQKRGFSRNQEEGKILRDSAEHPWLRKNVQVFDRC